MKAKRPKQMTTEELDSLGLDGLRAEYDRVQLLISDIRLQLDREYARTEAQGTPMNMEWVSAAMYAKKHWGTYLHQALGRRIQAGKAEEKRVNKLANTKRSHQTFRKVLEEIMGDDFVVAIDEEVMRRLS